jgi:hypothetical protein
VTGSVEHNNESSISTKNGEIVEKLTGFFVSGEGICSLKSFAGGPKSRETATALKYEPFRLMNSSRTGFQQPNYAEDNS